jgi:hypothetical protein
MTGARHALSIRYLTLACSSAIVAQATPAPFGDRVPSALGAVYRTGWAHDENSGYGFSYFRARTFVDCAHTRIGARQSADLFTGAYAHDAAGNVTSYLDAGILMQRDGLRSGELAVPDKVQMYAQASTAGTSRVLRYDDARPAAQLAYHVVCDTPLEIMMWIASSAEIDVAYAGTFRDKTSGAIERRRFVVRVRGFVSSDGWSPVCERCAVRRVVTLAVAEGAPTRVGSYVGIASDGANRIPTIPWDSSVRGAYRDGAPGSPSSYDLEPFEPATRDVVDAPSFGRERPLGRPAILIERPSPASERVGLDERAIE